MREDVVGEEHGLGVLEVGAARHRGVRVGLGEADQGVLEVEHQAADGLRVVPQVHPEEGGDLVVAGASGPQLAAEVGAEALQQAAFQGGVDVLVGDGAGEGAGLDVGEQPVEPVVHGGEFVGGEQAGLVQDAGVGLGAGDVVGGEAPVEVHRGGEPGQGLGGAVGEAGAPEADVATRGGLVGGHHWLLTDVRERGVRGWPRPGPRGWSRPGPRERGRPGPGLLSPGRDGRRSSRRGRRSR